MSRNSTLDTLSGKFFFTAIVINRAGKLTIPFVAHLSFVISTLLYLCGYVFWRTAVYEDDSRRHQFAQKQKEHFDNVFKHNVYYNYTALFGILSCIIALFSLTNPVCAVISAWLFLTSNACWYRAEGLTLKRLKAENPNSPEYKAQSLYYKYTSFSTFISLINPILFTLALLVPPVGVPLTSIATLYIIALNLISISNWVKSGRAFKRIPDKSTELSRLEIEGHIEDTETSSAIKILKRLPPHNEKDLRQQAQETTVTHDTRIVKRTDLNSESDLDEGAFEHLYQAASIS